MSSPEGKTKDKNKKATGYEWFNKIIQYIKDLMN